MPYKKARGKDQCGKTHVWYCQALWFGHWKTKSAATLGEEQDKDLRISHRLPLKQGKCIVEVSPIFKYIHLNK